jgi:hypothetical protein
MDWLKGLAPVLFSALSGNIPGAVMQAVSFLSEKFGWGDVTQEQAQEKLNNLTPEQTLLLKQYDLEFQKQITDQISMLTQIDIAQNQTNQAEETNTNYFISGWRPAAGWVCVIALFNDTFLRQILSIWNISFIPMDTSLITQVLFGMLGIGTLRTYEKIKGVASK